MTAIACKYCGSDIKPENINQANRIARCTQCGASFGVAAQMPPPPAAEPIIPEPTTPTPAHPTRRREYSAPASIKREELGTEVVFTRRWLGKSIWGHLLTLAVLLVIATGLDFEDFLTKLASLSLFHLVFSAVSVGFAYRLLYNLVNRTVVQVGAQDIVVRHGPLPTPIANKQLAVNEIKQLYACEVAHRGQRGRQDYSYELRVVFTGARADETLVAGLLEAEEALYLEQEIEKALRLPDEAVPGELYD